MPTSVTPGMALLITWMRLITGTRNFQYSYLEAKVMDSNRILWSIPIELCDGGQQVSSPMSQDYTEGSRHQLWRRYQNKYNSEKKNKSSREEWMQKVIDQTAMSRRGNKRRDTVLTCATFSRHRRCHLWSTE